MKRISVLSVFAALALTAACGGGGSSTPDTPTSEEAKAVAGAAQDRAMAGFGDAMSDGFEHFVQANIAAKAAQLKAGTNYSGTIDTTKLCGDNDESGSFTATGTLTGVCTGDPSAAWSCTNFAVQNLVITFTDCRVTSTQGSTTYNEVMNGTTSATITSGTVSGNGSGEGSITAMSVRGTLSGTPTLTGTVSGTVDLGSTTFDIELVDDEPEPTCGGTCSVTITDPAEAAGTEDCAVNTTCDGCQA